MTESFVLFYLHINMRKVIFFTLLLGDFCWGFGGGFFCLSNIIFDRCKAFTVNVHLLKQMPRHVPGI